MQSQKLLDGALARTRLDVLPVTDSSMLGRSRACKLRTRTRQRRIQTRRRDQRKCQSCPETQSKDSGKGWTQRWPRHVPIRMPSCQEAVASSVQTGQVDHRRVCGKRFSVRNGRAVAKDFVYECPYCARRVTSNAQTGQIDHRTVCGNQFYVRDGAVQAQTRQRPHKCPAFVRWCGHRFGLDESKSFIKCLPGKNARKRVGKCKSKRTRKRCNESQ